MDTITINKGHHLFDKLSNVIIARSTDQTRYFLMLCKIDLIFENNKPNKLRFICTDGRRLHYTETEKENCLDMEPGEYKVSQTKDIIVLIPKTDNDGTFPNYERVLPDLSTYTGGYTYTNHKQNKTYIDKFSVEHAKLLFNSKAVLNIQYLKDLPNENLQAKWHKESPEKCAIIFTGSITAVLMPMELK